MTALTKPTNLGDSVLCREPGIFHLFLGEMQTEEAKRMAFRDRKCLDTLVSRAGHSIRCTWSVVEFWLICPASEALWRKYFLFSHRQSLRRIEEVSLHALGSCRALGQKEAMQSLLKERSLSVLASSLFQLMCRELHSLKIWRLLVSCFPRRKQLAHGRS